MVTNLEAHAEAFTMSERFNDRDSSWLDFNKRVLAMANYAEVPLLERVNFLSITSANLDEFFQVRLSRLGEKESDSKQKLLSRLYSKCQTFLTLQEKIYNNLINELKKENIHIFSVEELSNENKEWISDYFDERVYPVLTPLAIDPAHPFPWISSLSINLGFILREPKSDYQRFARVKVPTNLERLIQIPGTTNFVPLEELIKHQWEKLFPGLDLESQFIFRVTRSSEYKLDEGDDILEAMSSVVRRSHRFGKAVRLEIQSGIDNSWTDILKNEITLEEKQIFEVSSFLDFTALRAIAKLEIPKLRYKKWSTQTPARLNMRAHQDMFTILSERDLLIHRPYETYEGTVETLVKQAAKDPNVLAIKQTLYRAAKVDSPIVQALCEAAENGKQVVALVELKARFDERANIERAKMLEQAGVHVVYGKVGLKTHAKLLHIVREELDGLHYYSHVSTGNYNPSTAGIYEDFDLFTADPRVGRDIGDLFNDLTGYVNISNYRELLVAPYNIREGLLEQINGQAFDGGSIILKCNNIVDSQVQRALCDAADAGATVNIIVRASCGFTHKNIENHPNITIRSIIGQFLEHSRIYKFGQGDEAKLYLGSADLMVRNMDHRVEALIPLYAEHTRRYVNEALSELLNSDNEHWLLTSKGWVLKKSDKSAHDELMAIALYRADVKRKLGDAQRNMPDKHTEE